jgi:hypothetical protein
MRAVRALRYEDMSRALTLGAMQSDPHPSSYPAIDPKEPVPDDPGELDNDTPDTLPPAPIEPSPDDRGGDPGDVPRFHLNLALNPVAE